MTKKIFITLICILILATLGYIVLENSRNSYQVQPINVKEKMAVIRRINVEHPYWKDTLVLDEKQRFYRDSLPNETGSVIKQTDQELTVQWDKWGRETFTRQENGIYKKLK